MKRPMLVSGTAIGLSSAFLVLAGIRLLPILLLGAVSVFIIYFIKPLKLREKIIIPTICASIILSCIFFGAYHFTKIIPATKLDKTITDVSGKIITTPQETATGIKFILKADRIGNSKSLTKIQVYLNNENDTDLKLYDYISLENTRLTIVRNEHNKPDATSVSDDVILETTATHFNYLWESEKTPYYYCLHFKERITEQVNSYLQPYHAGFLLGMLFGDKTDIDPDITNDFRATGIAHLLAVSGLHTSTWCTYIITLLALIRIKEKIRGIVCILFLVLLCIVSGFTPSVMRASIMMAVVLFAPFFNEEQDALNSLGFATAILTLQNPYIITSAGFLLSVFSTSGVLLSNRVSVYTAKIEDKLKHKLSVKLFRYISSGIIISVFTSIFTLPIFAYFFGKFSTLSPIANILCLKPAFWSLLSGVIATAISFIPLNITQTISVCIFKISTIFSNLVTGIANALERLEFCTLPIRKEYFLLSVILISVMVAVAFLIFKANNSKIKKAIVLSLCGLIFSLGILIPCTESSPATIYVTNVKNGINVTLRQGLKYGYFNCGASDSDIRYPSLPTAKIEDLDLLFIGNSNNSTDDITEYLTSCSPKTTIATEYAKNALNKSFIDLPENTIIADSYTYNFNKEITVQIVDTYPASCVIIKGSKKTACISYGSNNDLEFIFEVYGKPDVLILSDYSSDALPQEIDTLILSSDSDIALSSNISELKNQTKHFYATAENGDIKIIL